MHDLGRAVCGDSLGLLVPPLVAPCRPRNFLSGSLQYQNVLNEGTILERSINNSLGGDRLASALALVGGDDDTAFAVLDSVTQGLGGKAGEDHRVDGADSSAGKEGGHRLPVHGKVDRDGVALLDAEALEDVGDTADFCEEFAISDFFAVGRLVCFVNNSNLTRSEETQRKFYSKRAGLGSEIGDSTQSITK